MLESFRHVWDRASCVFSTFDIDQLMKIYQHYWKASLDVLWLLAFQSCKICLWISIPHGELPTHPSPNPTDIKTNFGLGKMSVRGGVVSRMFRRFSSLCPPPPPPPTPNTNVRNLSRLFQDILRYIFPRFGQWVPLTGQCQKSKGELLHDCIRATSYRRV